MQWARGLTTAAAIAVLSAGVAGGLYGYSEGVLPLFGRFGLDVAANVGGYYTNAKGEPFMLFDAGGDGQVDGRWERVTADRLGSTAGRFWIQDMTDSLAWIYAADGTTTGRTYNREGVEVYNLGDKANLWASAPGRLRVAAWDSLGHRSGDVWLLLETCTPDSVTVVPAEPDPGISPRNWYRLLIQEYEGGTWTTEHADLVDSSKYNTYALRPGQYRLYMSMVDNLGMTNHFMGPVQLNLGDPCGDMLAQPVPEE